MTHCVACKLFFLHIFEFDDEYYTHRHKKSSFIHLFTIKSNRLFVNIKKLNKIYRTTIIFTHLFQHITGKYIMKFDDIKTHSFICLELILTCKKPKLILNLFN